MDLLNSHLLFQFDKVLLLNVTAYWNVQRVFVLGIVYAFDSFNFSVTVSCGILLSCFGLSPLHSHVLIYVQGGSNMTGTNCDLFTNKSSRSYLNHLAYPYTVCVLRVWVCVCVCVCVMYIHNAHVFSRFMSMYVFWEFLNLHSTRISLGELLLSSLQLSALFF